MRDGQPQEEKKKKKKKNWKRQLPCRNLLDWQRGDPWTRQFPKLLIQILLFGCFSPMVTPTSPNTHKLLDESFVRRSDHQILWHFPSWAPRIDWKFYILPSVTWPITGRGEEEGEKLEKTAALQTSFELARGGPWTRQLPK